MGISRTPLRACYALTFLAYSSIYVLRLAMPLYLREIGASPEEIGLVLSVNVLSASLLAVPMGAVSDRLGRRRTVVGGLVLMMASTLLLLFSDGILPVLVASLGVGVGWGTFEPGLVAGLADLAGTARLGRVYGSFSAYFQGATSFGPALAGLMIERSGFTQTFMLSTGLAGLAVGVGVFGLPAHLDHTAARSSIGVAKSFASSGKALEMGLSGTFVAFLVLGGFEAFFPVYALEVGLSVATIGALFSAQSLISMLSRIPIGHGLDRVQGRVRFMTAGIVIVGLAVVLVPITQQEILLLVILGLMSVGRAMTNVAASTVIAEGTSSSVRGLSMGLSSTFRLGGMSAGPLVMTPVILAAGYAGAFPAVGLMGLGGVTVILLRDRSSRRSAQC